VVDSVHDRAEFVQLLSLFHWQPVQLLKLRCDVFTWLQLTDEASRIVLLSLWKMLTVDAGSQARTELQ